MRCKFLASLLSLSILTNVLLDGNDLSLKLLRAMFQSGLNSVKILDGENEEIARFTILSDGP